jgi:His/Glu/Gln/Arg/opine family amino acid ABC transporter permease subunit
MEVTMIDLPLIWDSLPSLLYGTGVSLQITLIAACLGLALGSILGLSEKTSSRPIRFLTGAYVTLFRGTPMLVQILFIYYVLPQFGLNIAPFWAASLAIGLNSGAYISQIILTGINAVSKGQIEAAYTLGFTRLKTIYYIVFPQAFRISLPALGNELVTLIKDSSLASIIGVMELSKEASIIRSRTYDAFSILLAVSIIYLILTATLSFCIKKYETRLKKYV